MYPNQPDVELGSPRRIKILDTQLLEADLVLPNKPRGVVLLVHGSGSSRLSPRNQFVAQMLRDHDLATLLLDVETSDERALRTETGRAELGLAEMVKRILVATEWLRSHEHTTGLPIGYLGAGTGAAAVLMAAAERPYLVQGIVARGGRTELVHSSLPRVQAPVLLIVGARDTPVVHHNREAIDNLGSLTKRLEIVPGAHHLFEEPGTLAAAAMHASAWLAKHLAADQAKSPTHAVVHLDA